MESVWPFNGSSAVGQAAELPFNVRNFWFRHYFFSRDTSYNFDFFMIL